MKNERKFSLNEICQNAKELLGVYPEVVYGAIFPMESKSVYTLNEIKEAINQFVKKEVV